jgi:hypothetical protein
MFFSHNKSANSIFQSAFSAKRTWRVSCTVLSIEVGVAADRWPMPIVPRPWAPLRSPQLWSWTRGATDDTCEHRISCRCSASHQELTSAAPKHRTNITAIRQRHYFLCRFIQRRQQQRRRRSILANVSVWSIWQNAPRSFSSRHRMIQRRQKSMYTYPIINKEFCAHIFFHKQVPGRAGHAFFLMKEELY